jgi:4-hydroxy-2-oxoheptanedioate aldolase
LEGGSPAFVQSTADAVIALMIEKKGAIENLEGILSVDGVDMVQFGPADYSMSLGLPGQKTHPSVKEAELLTIETAMRKGLHPRVEIQQPSQAAPYLKMGVQHFCMGTDVKTLFNYWKDQGAEMRAALSPQTGPVTRLLCK